MGYRSNWKLVVRAKNKESFDRFNNYFETIEYKGNRDKQDVIKFISSCINQQDDFMTVFSNESTKCYEPWGLVISNIIDDINKMNKVKGEIILSAAYYRFGEEASDIEYLNIDDELTNLYFQVVECGEDFGNFE